LPDNYDGPVAYEATKYMVENYPRETREWIAGKGGAGKMPYDGFWILPAEELWGMGYRRYAE
jgi:hypothetical protein